MQLHRNKRRLTASSSLILAAACASLINANSAYAASGIFQTFVITNAGASNTYYDTELNGSFSTLNPDWVGTNLGTFHAAGSISGTSTLLLNGAEVKTFKNGGTDITGASLHYRIYRQGSTAPNFTTVNLGFGANLPTAGDQRWETTGLGFNTLAGRDAGVNQFEVYHSATFTEPNNSTGTHFTNNGGANYIATFTVNTGTFLWDGGAGAASTASANNWSNNIAPGNRHNIQFAGSTQTSVSNTFSRVNSIAFNSGASPFTLSGAALEIAGGGITNNSGSAQTISANLTNTAANVYHTGSVANGSLAISGTVNNGGNLLTIDGTNDSSFSNQISGSGGLTKAGDGTATLSNSNSYSGATTISAGKLTLATAGSINNTSSVSVFGGAVLQLDGSLSSPTITVAGTLQGTGQINGSAVNLNGTLSPGNSIGKLTINTGTLTLGDDSTTNMEIATAGLAQGSDFDAVAAPTIVFDGQLNVNFDAGGTFAAGNQFNLFDGNAGASDFDGIAITGQYSGALSSLGSGNWSQTISGLIFSFSSSTGTLTLSASAVPEPLTAAGVLLLTGRVLGRRSRVSL